MHHVRNLVAAGAALLAIVCAVLALHGVASAQKAKYKVYLSMSYIGNDWQAEAQKMVSAMAASSTLKDKVDLQGPFETIDLNAPGGIADYAQRYGPLYYEIARQAQARPWSDALVRQVESERRSVLPAAGLAQRSAWRDKRLMLLAAHKALAAQLVDAQADAQIIEGLGFEPATPDEAREMLALKGAAEVAF